VVEADLALGASLTMIDRHYGHLARRGGGTPFRSSTSSTPRQRYSVETAGAAWTCGHVTDASGGIAR
jgi:hypothetical protein